MKKGSKHSKKALAKISVSGKGRIPWNKGLYKETDERVAKYTKSLVENGNLHSCLGQKRSKSTIKKMKEQHRTNPRMGMKGKTPWNKGLTKENSKSVMKMAKANKGKVRTEEMKRNVSKSIKKGFKNGRKVWNDGLKNPYSEETLKKMGVGSRKKFIRQMEEAGKIITPFYNNDACDFFTILNKRFKLKGVHAKNKGEHCIKELGYFVDFYEPTLNIVIEWNEKRHYFQGRLTPKHLNRQSMIKKKLKCSFINIKESTFDLEKSLSKIEKVIRKKRLKLVS